MKYASVGFDELNLLTVLFSLSSSTWVSRLLESLFSLLRSLCFFLRLTVLVFVDTCKIGFCTDVSLLVSPTFLNDLYLLY